MKRSSNQELCEDFRVLLTHGFDVEPGETFVDKASALEATKPWRAKIWKAFRELEDRLCPLEALVRTRDPL